MTEQPGSIVNTETGQTYQLTSKSKVTVELALLASILGAIIFGTYQATVAIEKVDAVVRRQDRVDLLMEKLSDNQQQIAIALARIIK